MYDATDLTFRGICAVVAVVVITGCVGSADHPPLPRGHETYGTANANAPDDVRELVSSAEIFYLPIDGPVFSDRSATLRFLRALRASDKPAAIGWAVVPAREQDALDAAASGAPRIDDLVEEMAARTRAARENYQTVLAANHDIGLAAIALGCNDNPNDYACLAANIERAFHQRGVGKMLILIERRGLEPPRSVSFFIQRTLGLRQVVLDSLPPARERGHLLTDRGRAMQIVNRAPGTGSDRR